MWLSKDMRVSLYRDKKKQPQSSLGFINGRPGIPWRERNQKQIESQKEGARESKRMRE